MTVRDLAALSPLIIVAVGAALVMVSIAVRRNHAFCSTATVVLLVAAAVTAASRGASPARPGVLLVIDSYSVFFITAILLSTAFVAAFAYGYLKTRTDRPEEFYILLMTGALGASVVAASDHLIALFLGLELLSLSLYALLAYLRQAPSIVEAGTKYLVLASASAAVLLFGIALAYYATGTMDFGPKLLHPGVGTDLVLWWTGMLLILAGLGFKLALVPFHMWTPDIYQGAATPAAAFIATASKGAALAVLFRIVLGAGPEAGRLVLPLGVIAAISMLAGNVLAVMQNNVKRILGYSSVANMGYLMVPVVAGGARGASATAFYFAAYAATILVAFGVLAVVEPSPVNGDPADPSRGSGLDDFRGLFWTRPWLAGLMTLAFLSLAGIPLTAGFVGKVVLVLAGASGALWVLLVILAIGSAIGLFYYLRVLIAMYDTGATGQLAVEGGPGVGVATAVSLALLGIAVVWWGVVPEALVRVVQTLVLR